MGIMEDDPRVYKMIEHLKENCAEDITIMDLTKALSWTGTRCNPHIEFITKVMTSDLLISEFSEFSAEMKTLFNKCKSMTSGKVCDRIPELAKVPAKNWGVSICTIEGQRLNLGDTNVPFSIQSISQPLSYAFSVEHYGTDYIHQFVGHEPSGAERHAIVLNKDNLPHNPLINSGGIMIASLLRPELTESERFEYILQMWQKMAGGKTIQYD